jgi:transcriptional regulator with XRE-family HTH domain
VELHEKIRLLRKSKGVSQTFIAAELNISISGYNMKENGNRPISISELQIIGKLLNVSPSIFFDDNFHVKLNLKKGKEVN